jgi:hypothetical protein
MESQTRERMILIGASALGATVVLAGAFWALQSASQRGGLKVRVVTVLEPADRNLLKILVQEAHIASSELSASLDRITERGIDLNFRPFGGKKTSGVSNG